MPKKKDRQEVAEELAQKDGHKFEELTDMMKGAYLHNADEAIIDQDRVVVTTKPVLTALPCPRCDGSGWIDGQPCRECNQVGLNPPGETIGDGTGHSLPDADDTEKENKVDNEEDEGKEEKTEEKPEKKTRTKPDKIPANMFWCPHCSQLHQLDKAKGKRHFKKYIKKD